MNPRLVRQFIYPWHEALRGRRTFDNLRELEATQWWPAERLREWQQVKLRALFRHAVGHCPYYGEVFAEAGVDPHGREPLSALPALPLLDKDTIRRRRQELTWAQAPGGLHEAATGGSTGHPLLFYFDRRRQGYDKAARMRTHRWFGVDVGDREVYLWGSPHEINTQHRLKEWRDRLTNELLLSAFALTPGRMDEYLARIARFEPRCLFGYPSSLALLCEHGLACGRIERPASLRAVFVTGELLDEGQRRVISDCFRVPVADGYGSREAGFLAHECPHGAMHVTDENVILEVVDESGHPVEAGACGEIVVTHLDAYAMPLIRYRTGDAGRRIAEPCACGRGLSRMEVVGGRKTDHLVARDGTVMHGLSVIYVLRETPGVRQFQVRQDAGGAVTIRIVPDDELDADGLRRIERGVRDVLGWDAELSIEPVERLEVSASGKFRCVVSEAVEAGAIP